MKRIITAILCVLVVSCALAQTINEKEIKTEVSEVTVFIKGAQMVNKKSIDLLPGVTLLKFTNLSPYIDSKSVQVKAQGDLMVLSVNYQQNFIEKLEQPKELIELEQQLLAIKEKISMENTYLSILADEITFLKDNRIIGGKSQEVNITNLKEASQFYSSKLTALRLSEIEHQKTILDLGKQRNNINNQINTLSTTKEFPMGEVLVKVEATKAIRADFELLYMVENAGWYPTYDLRVDNIAEPIDLVYKANVWQDTKVDWKNVKLKFSSANPSLSGIAPQLQTYFLDYNSAPPRYKMNNNSVHGKVTDSNGMPLPSVNILIEGTTIGTVSDNQGNYSLTLPNNSVSLTFSFIGYKKKTVLVRGEVLNVSLEEDVVEINEVVFGSTEAEESVGFQGTISGVTVKGKKVGNDGVAPLRDRSKAIPVQKTENQTNVEFEIQKPYTINSDNKNYAVDMANYNIPANYAYYCVPKIDKKAYLNANIIDWEKYNLLEGEANIFFESTFIGKTILDVRYATDTLMLSLGHDKNISVVREKVKDYTSRQFIGTKKEENRGWKTTVKNNKNQPIDMILLDQVPISGLEEIEVSVQNNSGAKQNPETGEVKWEFTLKPKETKELQLNYSVKYPKNRNLIVE